MDTAERNTPLLVIVGPTASGKSALALELAVAYGGEIICADSRTVYKHMDIGTAKPSSRDRNSVPHHLLDLVEPDQIYTAAMFKQDSQSPISEIASRGKLPMVVGGTGLYVDGLIFDYAFLPPVDASLRDELQQMSVEALQHRIVAQGIRMPENSQNKRHLVRTLETNGAVPVKRGLRKDTLVLGLDVSKEDLAVRIAQRTNTMIHDGLEAETRQLAARYSWDAPGLSAVGYQEWREAADAEAAREDIIRSTMQYAKRQRTWFKRNPHISWIKNSAEAEKLTKQFLQRYASK